MMPKRRPDFAATRAAARFVRRACAVAATVLLAVAAPAGATPLHDAAAAGDAARLRELLDALRAGPGPGAAAQPAGELDALDAAGRTPLLRAVEGDHADAVGLLLGAGASPNVRGADGAVPLVLAVERRQAAIVGLLAKAGARTDVATTALLARKNLDDRLVMQTAYEATPLHLAAAQGDVGSVAALVAAGADVNAEDENRRTPLHYAVTADEALAEVLLRTGADANVVDVEGATPFLQAVLDNREPWLFPLVAAGADIDYRDPRGRTPVFWAASVQMWMVFATVVDLGADVNIPDDRGRTPLMAAAEAGNVDAARRLLKAGADIDHLDPEGTGALHVAVEHGQRGVVELLLAAGADPNRSTGKGVPALLRARDRDMLALVLRKGGNIDVAGGPGRARLLHVAAAQGDLDMLRWLLRKRADVHATNAMGDTALHVAAFNGQVEAVRVLLDAGADFNRRNNKDAKPIQYADFAKQEAVVRLLEERGSVLEPYTVH